MSESTSARFRWGVLALIVLLALFRAKGCDSSVKLEVRRAADSTPALMAPNNRAVRIAAVKDDAGVASPAFGARIFVLYMPLEVVASQLLAQNALEFLEATAAYLTDADRHGFADVELVGDGGVILAYLADHSGEYIGAVQAREIEANGDLSGTEIVDLVVKPIRRVRVELHASDNACSVAGLPFRVSGQGMERGWIDSPQFCLDETGGFMFRAIPVALEWLGFSQIYLNLGVDYEEAGRVVSFDRDDVERIDEERLNFGEIVLDLGGGGDVEFTKLLWGVRHSVEEGGRQYGFSPWACRRAVIDRFGLVRIGGLRVGRAYDIFVLDEITLVQGDVSGVAMECRTGDPIEVEFRLSSFPSFLEQVMLNHPWTER